MIGNNPTSTPPPSYQPPLLPPPLQGIYNDSDGSLLNAGSLPAALLPTGFALGAGATWHSAVNNDLFDPAGELDG